jgi:hypothetical protein
MLNVPRVPALDGAQGLGLATLPLEVCRRVWPPDTVAVARAPLRGIRASPSVLRVGLRGRAVRHTSPTEVAKATDGRRWIWGWVKRDAPRPSRRRRPRRQTAIRTGRSPGEPVMARSARPVIGAAPLGHASRLLVGLLERCRPGGWFVRVGLPGRCLGRLRAVVGCSGVRSSPRSPECSRFG